MVDTGELESFLNEKSAKENDVCKILEEGLIEQKEDPNTHRRYRVLNMPVRCNNRDLIYTPNKEAIAEFQRWWGTNTKDWKGHKFSIKFYPKTAFGVTRMAILPVKIEV